jgi:MFS family permease
MEEQPRNRSLLAWEGLAAAMVANLATAFASMFAARMGASDFQIGLVSSLPPVFGLAVLIPAALATDRMKNKRRMVEISILMLAACYLAVGLTPFLGEFRVWGMVGLFALSNAPAAIYGASWQAYFSDVVPPDLRNDYYARRTKLIFLTGAVVVLLTGLLLAYLPRTDGDRIHLYQLFFAIAFLASFLQIQLIRKVQGGDAPRPATEARHRLASSMRSLLHSRPFLAFSGLSLLLYVAWQMAWPLFFLTQVRYLGADEAWMSWIAVLTALLNMATTGYWSRFIARHGVRLTLVIGIIGLATSPFIYLVSTYLPASIALPALFVLTSLIGLTFPAFQLALFQCLLEVIGEDDKTLRIAIFYSMTLVSNILAPLFGVWMYTSLGSDRWALSMTMGLSTLLRLVAAGAFAVRWIRLRGTPDVGKSLQASTALLPEREEDPIV